LAYDACRPRARGSLRQNVLIRALFIASGLRQKEGMTMYLRSLMVMSVCLGLVLPKVTAALAHILPNDHMTMVICTGDAMITMTFDADGNPVEQTQSDETPCPLVLASVDVQTHDVAWHILARQIERQPTPTPWRLVQMLRPVHPPRAPPLFGRNHS
jgi:hypothetical protein